MMWVWNYGPFPIPVILGFVSSSWGSRRRGPGHGVVLSFSFGSFVSRRRSRVSSSEVEDESERSREGGRVVWSLVSHRHGVGGRQRSGRGYSLREQVVVAQEGTATTRTRVAGGDCERGATAAPRRCAGSGGSVSPWKCSPDVRTVYLRVRALQFGATLAASAAMALGRGASGVTFNEMTEFFCVRMLLSY
jgi:hypothetical protein